MKTLFITTTILTMTLTSFTIQNPISVANETNTSEQLSEKIIQALQYESEAEYLNLFPSLEEFHSLMNENESLYGPNLAVAKFEFANEYNETLIPSVKRSFSEIIKAGTDKGIRWSEIKFVRAEFRLEDKTGLSVPGMITFAWKENQYTLRLEKAIVLKENWRIGQYISFI